MPSWFQPVATGFLVSAGLVTVAVVGWAVWWVPWHRRTGWRAIVQQGAAVLVSVVCSVAMIGLMLNRSNDWYPTWRSVLGVRDSATVQPFGGPAQTAPVAASDWGSGSVSSLQADPRNNPAFAGQTWQDDTAQGQYLRLNIIGPTSGMTSETLIWLPPGYLSHPERRYPVIFAFQGIPGSVDAYQQNLPVGQIIPSLVSAQRIRDAIVVVPTVFPNNLDTECVDSADGSVRMDTFVSSDLVAWAKANLRTVDRPDAWATLGFSAGGWCSSMLTLRHPETFGYSLSLSGYFQIRFNGSALRPDGDPVYDLGRIASEQAPSVKLWFWTAKDDSAPYDSVQQFAPKVRAPTVLTVALVEAGGHSWAVWTAGTQAGLQWLGENSAQFAWVAS